jgi:small-conductance mechanosensitive channel
MEILTLISNFTSYVDVNPIYLAVSLLISLVALIYKIFARTLIHEFVKSTDTTLDDELVEKTEVPIKFFLLLVSIYFLLLGFNYHQGVFINVLATLIWADICYILFVVANIFLDHAKHLPIKLDDRLKSTSLAILKNLILVVVVFLFFVASSSIWGIDITPLVASAGVLGLILGFAIKDILENILAGILILFDPPCRVGDMVKISDEMGYVDEIGIRYTKIRKFDNNVVIIPNRDLLNEKIINFNKPNDIVRVGADYASGGNVYLTLTNPWSDRRAMPIALFL